MKDVSKKKMGRPPIDNARDERIQIRVTKEEKELLQKKALEKGLTLTELIISLVKE